MKRWKRKISALLAITLSAVPSMVLADDFYRVKGESMFPTLKDGDVIKKLDTKYKDGNVVVAKVKKTGETIVKRIQGDMLIGDGYKTTNYNKSEVEILGTVEKNEKSSQKVTQVAKASTTVDMSSPIKKAYAGAEYALFLHQDTSLTGFGSNVNEVLGISGGESSNTGELVKVSGPTGFEFIKARKYNAYGFRPLLDNPNLYDWIHIVRGNLNTKLSPEPVKDADWSGRTAPAVNHHDGWTYISENSKALTRGSDYATYLGIGISHPEDRYLQSGWRNVSASNPPSRVLVDSFENTDNSVGGVTVTTKTFSPHTKDWDIRWNIDNKLQENVTLNIEVLDVSGNVLKTYNESNKTGDTAPKFNSKTLKVTELPIGTYKLRVRSSHTQWKVWIEDRVDFTGAKEVYWTDSILGRFMMLDENKDVYLHDIGWGNVRKMNAPADFRLQSRTIEAGDSHYAGIDEQGRVWTWSTGVPTMPVFPNVDGVPFYEKNKIMEVSAGGDFTMAISETKDEEKKKHVWVWGSNAYGKLGLEGVTASNVTNPTIVKKGGVPLENIQSVAAGEHFSVIVQNISDGQLIWTAGRNNKGQLGGGVTLDVLTPQQIPGLTGITNIFARNTPEAFAFTDDTIYTFGGNKSYPSSITINSIMGYPKEFQSAGWATGFLSKSDGTAWSDGFNWAGGAGSLTGGFDKIAVNPTYKDSRNGGQTYFVGTKSISFGNYFGQLVDKNGKLWGWGKKDMNGAGPYNTNRTGDGGDYHYLAHPMVMDAALTEAPLGFTKVRSTSLGGYALKGGKLWSIGTYVTPIPSSEAVNSIDIVDIENGSNFYLAIDSQGFLWTWGDNGKGQLGLGNATSRSYPTKVNPSYYDNKKVVSIAGGTNHSLFVTEDGSVYAMGKNEYGKLGTGNREDSNVPRKILNVTNAKKVAAGSLFSLALDKQGRVWSWGYAAEGSLGNNFSLSRQPPSTAYGNELPEMTTLNNIQDNYLSKFGNKEFKLYGSIKEKERESVTMKATVLGVEKQAVVSKESWSLDIYDQVKPVSWELKWNVDEVDKNTNFQSLTKIVTEDERGGLVEQFYSGRIIVDNEKPQIPTWGETCVIDKTNGEICHESNYFKMDGTNGVDKPIRIYMNPIQKVGEFKAPVKMQMQYRIKQPYGYPAKWSDWIDVTTYNSKGYYYDFFQGFLGEAQIKIRAKDLAGNTSDDNNEYRYSIITNAGAEITNVSGESRSVENKLINDLKITASSTSSSALKTFGVSRRLLGETNWTNLTPNRVAWQGDGEQSYSDETGELLGNATYEYVVDAENSVAIGKSKIVPIITHPYEPINFIRKVDTEGIRFIIKQDDKNRGKILYRLVLVDNQSGKIYKQDKTSNRVKEEVVYHVKEEEVPFSILNNSITIKLLIQGENKKFVTVIYDENFESSPSVIDDKNPPEGFVGIEGSPERIVDDGINKINLVFSATDDVSLNKKLKVQFSPDGTKWYGQKKDGSWSLNLWSDYKSLYTGFSMGGTIGSRIVYAKVKDEAGNIGIASTPILISQLVQRDDNVFVSDKIRHIISKDTLSNPVHINNAYVYLDMPKTGNAKEVRYSFDGVKWSPWERLNNGDNTKFITLPPYEGEHTIMVRYRNELGDVTRVKEDYDIIKYVLDKEKPSIQVETNNGTYIVKDDSVVLLLTTVDNLSEKMDVKFRNNQYQYFVDGVQVQSYKFENDLKKAVFIKGLAVGFNIINLEVTDMAGNKMLKTIRVFRK